jgi:hypothetical protein
MPDAVVRNVVTGLYAAWQRDGGDGVTRDETAWTWWTLPPVIAGCFAQRYHRQPPTSSCPCGSSQNAAHSGVMPARRMHLRVLSTAAARCAHHNAAARPRNHLEAEPVVVGPFLLDDGLPVDRPLHRWRERFVRDGQHRDWRYAAPDGSGCG